LAVHFDDLVRQVRIGPEFRDWMVMALKASHQEEITYHEAALDNIQAELKRVKHRLDQLYVDKLDGKVTEAYIVLSNCELNAEACVLATENHLTCLPKA
jgi:hypothetical protein